ncbi:hypothetical protein HDU88_004545 [Geranomyces variabilis]|nr:hypothetical protein HDU88_004545 [Geranomyces variabilis]
MLVGKSRKTVAEKMNRRHRPRMHAPHLGGSKLRLSKPEKTPSTRINMADPAPSECVLLPVISRLNGLLAAAEDRATIAEENLQTALQHVDQERARVDIALAQRNVDRLRANEAAAKLAKTISDLQAAAEANADAAKKAGERAAAAENNLLSVMERAAKETARADDAQVQREEYRLRANEAAAKLAKTVTDLKAAAETKAKAAESNLQIALERATVAESNLHTARRQSALEKARADAAEAQQSTDCIYAESVATNLAKIIVDLKTKVQQLEAKLQAVGQPVPDKLSTPATRSSLRGVAEQPQLWKSSTSPANASQQPVQQSEPRDLSASQPEPRKSSTYRPKRCRKQVSNPNFGNRPICNPNFENRLIRQPKHRCKRFSNLSLGNLQQPELRKSSTPQAKESLQAGQQSEPRKSSVSPAKASLQPSASPAKESLQAVQQFEHRKSSTSPSPSAVSSSPGPPPIPVSPRDSGDESSSRQRIFKAKRSRRTPLETPCDDNESSKVTERTISSPAPKSTPTLQKAVSSSKSSAEASTKNDGSGEPVRNIKLIFASSK